MQDRKMSVGQAMVEFFARQWTVDGAVRQRSIPGLFGIFGHGNVAGLGQALKEYSVKNPQLMPYYQGRNEQAMVHQAVAYARMNRRRATFACTASVGPGATNMLTGAALATINRLPVLLLPSDTFATRVADPVLQQLEQPFDASLSVNDAFKPLSRFFDRVQRPEQLFSACLSAMRVLFDPVETGAVTIALPEDVQAETILVPAEFLSDREWHIHRPAPTAESLERALAVIRQAKRPLIIAGGGVIYADAHEALRRLVEETGVPVGCTQAGMGSLSWDHPQCMGAVGATGTFAANRLAAEADVVIGVGTRYSDFTTSSRAAFRNPDVRFVNINVASFDAYKHSSTNIIADARPTLEALLGKIPPVAAEYRAQSERCKLGWDETVDKAVAVSGRELPGQPEIIGAVNEVSSPEDVVVCAAGSLPGDLHKLYRVRDELGYHVEYGFSCMGYEIAAGLGVARAGRTPIVMVGDGSYLMMNSEIITAVAEGLKVIIVLIQNHGFASIGHLSETVGSQRYGTLYRYHSSAENHFEGEERLPVDLAMHAQGMGIRVIKVEPGPEVMTRFKQALAEAKAQPDSTLIHIDSDPLVYAPDGEGWWDVPVPEVSDLPSTRTAWQQYQEGRRAQRPTLGM